MEILIILIAVIVAVAIGMKAHREMVYRRLRAQPPERVILELTLPHGEFRSQEKWAGVLNRIGSITSQSSELARTGNGEIDLTSYVENRKLHVTIACDPEYQREVRQAIMNAYGKLVGIKTVDSNDFPPHQMAAQYRAFRDYREPAQD